MARLIKSDAGGTNGGPAIADRGLRIADLNRGWTRMDADRGSLPIRVHRCPSAVPLVHCDLRNSDLTQRREGAEAQRAKQKLGKQKAEMLCRFASLRLGDFALKRLFICEIRGAIPSLAVGRAVSLRLCVGFCIPIAWKMAGGVMESCGEGWLNLTTSPLLQHSITPLGLFGKGGEIKVN